MDKKKGRQERERERDVGDGSERARECSGEPEGSWRTADRAKKGEGGEGQRGATELKGDDKRMEGG